MTEWRIGSRAASLTSIAARLAETRTQAARAEQRQRESREDRRVRQQERDAAAMGRAVRKNQRDLERRAGRWIGVTVKALSGGGGGGRRKRYPRFEAMVGHAFPARPSKRGKDGLSSFHFRWTSRGLGKRRRNAGHRYRPREAVRHVHYILRPIAREIEEGGIVSNISADRGVIAAFFDALEELERQGQKDANVYISLVVSLPHELTADQRLDTLRDICAVPGGFDLPHVGVLHAPDPDGDQRNYHAHIMLSLRQAVVEDEGRFSFNPEKHSHCNSTAFIEAWRSKTADALNRAMQRAGHERRFTALSNSARGEAPPRNGKSTPGATHRQRRQQSIARMRAELDLIAGLDRSLAAMDKELITITGPTRPDRQSALGARYRAVVATMARMIVPASDQGTARRERLGEALARAQMRIESGAGTRTKTSSTPDPAHAFPPAGGAAPPVMRGPGKAPTRDSQDRPFGPTPPVVRFRGPSENGASGDTPKPAQKDKGRDD